MSRDNNKIEIYYQYNSSMTDDTVKLRKGHCIPIHTYTWYTFRR